MDMNEAMNFFPLCSLYLCIELSSFYLCITLFLLCIHFLQVFSCNPTPTATKETLEIHSLTRTDVTLKAGLRTLVDRDVLHPGHVTQLFTRATQGLRQTRVAN